MKFSKNWKRFFTLDRHHAEGFTLVELIVVIAILAILAGIAVPAYSGYIEKANEAADQTLLGAVNTAFAAACVKEGVDVSQIDSATVVKGNGSKGWTVSGVTPAEFSDSFLAFYGDNMNSEFQVFKSLVFDAEKHVFVDPAYAESVTVKYRSSYISVSGNTVTSLQNSSYKDIGAKGLLDTVDSLTDLLADEYPSYVESLIEDENFVATYGADIDAAAAAILAANPDADPEEVAMSVAANAAVLHVANTTSGMTTEQATNLLSGGSASDTTEALAQAALIYGLYTAQTGNPNADVSEAMKNRDQLAEYVKTEQGQADLNAYLTALGTVSNNTGSGSTVTSDVLVNGYSSEELQGLLNNLMGSSN